MPIFDRCVGARLTRLYSFSPEASWVANASTGTPTNYAPHQWHKALLARSDVITSGSDLAMRMKQSAPRWQALR